MAFTGWQQPEQINKYFLDLHFCRLQGGRWSTCSTLGFIIFAQRLWNPGLNTKFPSKRQVDLSCVADISQNNHINFAKNISSSETRAGAKYLGFSTLSPIYSFINLEQLLSERMRRAPGLPFCPAHLYREDKNRTTALLFVLIRLDPDPRFFSVRNTR